jgi:hypothetical protein
VQGEAAQGVVKCCGWHGMQGVRGSNPLSSARHNASSTSALSAVCQKTRAVAARTLFALGGSDGFGWARGRMRTAPGPGYGSSDAAQDGAASGHPPSQISGGTLGAVAGPAPKEGITDSEMR